MIRYRRSVCLCLSAAAGIGGLGTSATAEAAQTVWFTQQGCTVWSVPAGVRTVHVRATGQAGVAPKGIFGLGDRVSATITRLAGQALDVCVAYGGESTGGGASGVGLGSTFSYPLLVAGGGGGRAMTVSAVRRASRWLLRARPEADRQPDSGQACSAGALGAEACIPLALLDARERLDRFAVAGQERIAED